MGRTIGFQELATLNDRYARAIDEDKLEEWSEFFSERCLYKVTTADNFRRNYPAGLIYADSRAMLKDRVNSLRIANVYEQHRYRHVIGAPAILSQNDDVISCESSFLVIRIMRDGTLSLFSTGKYVDDVVSESDGLKFSQRIVVCDGGNVDAMLAIPL